MSAMHPQSTPPDNSWENDPVWNLLAQAPPTTPSPTFAANTVRAARLLNESAPWWKRLLSPAPLAGMAVAAAAVALAVFPLLDSGPAQTLPTHLTHQSPQAAAIQDIAEAETLIAAVDQLDDFSDNELVSLIGF